MKMFVDAFEQYGCDSMAIAEACGITEAVADSLINACMNVDYTERMHRRRVNKIAYAGKEPFMAEWA